MRGFPKKIVEFAGKFCSFKRRRYLCTTKPIRWIHLRVRIRASHARHRGSNPLSTTKSDCNSRFLYFCTLKSFENEFSKRYPTFVFQIRFPRFSNDVCFPMPCVPNFPRRHVADVFKCSGRPFRGGRCGIEVKGYLIGWWVYFSDLLLNLSN